MTDDDERVDVRSDGRIILYKRQGLKNPKWQARIRVPNAAGYKIVSTKTPDLKEAERFARDLYEELYLHVKAGGSLRSRTFRQVFEEWERVVPQLGATRQGGSWEGTIARVRSYALPFFGTKRIDAITEADFFDYFVWRKANYARRRPTDGTLRRERTSLMAVFKYALAKGYISRLPDAEPPKAKSERRPTFTPREWERLTRKMDAWVKEGEAKATWRDRYVAQQYFQILANTGMRVGELRGLRWRDLRVQETDGDGWVIAHVNGKTGRREVVFLPVAAKHMKRLHQLRCREVAEQSPDLPDPKPEMDGFVICHKDGSAIQTLKRSFQSLLAFAEVPTGCDGGTKTIYSLRHFYATQRLSHETSPFLLAKQMGTSVEMLEKFYGHTVTASLAAQITKTI